MTTSNKYVETLNKSIESQVRLTLSEVIECYESMMYDLWLSGFDLIEEPSRHKDFFIEVLKPRILRNKKAIIKNSNLHYLLDLI